MSADTLEQLENFRTAVAALGGQRAAARALEINERTMRALYAGERRLHDGFLEDTARALARHAKICRELERLLTPAFGDNLTADQAAKRERRQG